MRKNNSFVAIFSILISLHNKCLRIVITFKQERLHSKLRGAEGMPTFTFNYFKLRIILTLTCDKFSNEMHIRHDTIATQPRSHTHQEKKTENRWRHSLKYIELEME